MSKTKHQSIACSASMLTEKQQMEHQLQETAGELVDAERELSRRSPSASPRLRRKVALVSGGFELDGLNALAVGPDTPPAAHPGRAAEDDAEAGHIIIAGGGLIAFDNLRKEFDGVMQVGSPGLCQFTNPCSQNELLNLLPALPPADVLAPSSL